MFYTKQLIASTEYILFVPFLSVKKKKKKKKKKEKKMSATYAWPIFAVFYINQSSPSDQQ